VGEQALKRPATKRGEPFAEGLPPFQRDREVPGKRALGGLVLQPLLVQVPGHSNSRV